MHGVIPVDALMCNFKNATGWTHSFFSYGCETSWADKQYKLEKFSIQKRYILILHLLYFHILMLGNRESASGKVFSTLAFFFSSFLANVSVSPTVQNPLKGSGKSPSLYWPSLHAAESHTYVGIQCHMSGPHSIITKNAYSQAAELSLVLCLGSCAMMFVRWMHSHSTLQLQPVDTAAPVMAEMVMSLLRLMRTCHWWYTSIAAHWAMCYWKYSWIATNERITSPSVPPAMSPLGEVVCYVFMEL